VPRRRKQPNPRISQDRRDSATLVFSDDDKSATHLIRRCYSDDLSTIEVVRQSGSEGFNGIAAEYIYNGQLLRKYGQAGPVSGSKTRS